MVRIYPDYKVIFYSNSKCASTTLKIAFGKDDESGVLGLSIQDRPRKPAQYYIKNYKNCENHPVDAVHFINNAR